MCPKVLDHGWEHVVEGDPRVHAEDQVVDKDKGGHGCAGLRAFCRLGVGRLGYNARDFADFRIEESDSDGVGGSNCQGCLPVHEKVIVFGKRDPGWHRSRFHRVSVSEG